MRRSQLALLVTAGLALATGGAYFTARLQKARVKRAIMATMSDIHSLRAALNQYAEVNGGLFPPPNPSDPDIKGWDAVMVRKEAAFVYPVRSVAWLRPHLQRFFNRPMPDADSWGHPLFGAVSRDRRSYTLVSLGSDGQRDVSVQYSWPIAETAHDLVFLDDSFISAPDGVTH